jgi:6,7-dimethyl-8-ribityllumazine synthase
MKIIEGELQAKGLKFGIVISRFNEFITSKLLDGAKDALVRHGAKDDDIDVAKVPGSFEIPMIAKKMAAKGVYNAIICLGTVIRGATPHFEYISAEFSKGIASRQGRRTMFGKTAILLNRRLKGQAPRAETKGGMLR